MSYSLIGIQSGFTCRPLKTTMANLEAQVEFREMFSICHLSYKLIGVQPLFRDVAPSKLWSFFFWLSFWNLVLTYIAEYVFIATAFGKFGSFLQLIALIPCMCYVTISINAMIVMITKRSRLIAIITTLEDQFPRDLDEQRAHKIANKKRQFDRPLFLYFGVFVVLVMTFNCVPFMITLIDYIKLGIWEKSLPYFVWYPFDEFDDRYFAFIYVHQSLAGFTTVFGIMGELFMTGACVLQFCIQFQRISSSIREYRPHKDTDQEFLKNIITQHNYILTNAQELADILSATLFIHQTCSSIVICCVGFQVVVGDNITTIIKFLEFLVCSLIQSIVVSYFGNQIMEYVSGSLRIQ